MISPARTLVASFLVLAACSSTPSPSSSGDGDAGVGPNRPLGATCDPTLVDACSPIAGACSIAVCDAKSLRCKVVTSDAGGCSGVQIGCATDTDCSGGACVQGLCYARCLTSHDCDGGTCTTVCPSDASTNGCKAYCTGT